MIAGVEAEPPLLALSDGQARTEFFMENISKAQPCLFVHWEIRKLDDYQVRFSKFFYKKNQRAIL